MANPIFNGVEELLSKIPAEEPKLIAEGKHIVSAIKTDMTHLLNVIMVKSWVKKATAVTQN